MRETGGFIIDKPLQKILEGMTVKEAADIIAEQRLVHGNAEHMAAAQIVDELPLAREAIASYQDRERLTREYFEWKKGLREKAPAKLAKFLPQVVAEVINKLDERLSKERRAAEAMRAVYRLTKSDKGSYACPLCQNTGTFKVINERHFEAYCPCLGDFSAKVKPTRQKQAA